MCGALAASDYTKPERQAWSPGWWRHQATGNVIAVLDESSSRSGEPMVIAAKYNFNVDTRGNGIQLLTRNLLGDYVQEPDDLDAGLRIGGQFLGCFLGAGRRSSRGRVWSARVARVLCAGSAA